MRRQRTSPDPARTSARRWAGLVVVVTTAYALVPLLFNSGFYLQSDTAVQFAPTWYHLGHLVRSGHWPPTMDPGSWVGGNYAAEALFGVYNPLNLLLYVGFSFTPDLLVGVLIVKLLLLVALALGIWLLAREYGASPAASAVLAVALPLAGFLHYFDAAAFPSGLMAFTYAPWVWWAFRRAARGRSGPLPAVIVGALAVTQGNPYGTLAVVVIGVGVIVETLASGHRDGALRLAVIGGCVACFLPLVYVPLIESSALAVRAGGPLIGDSGRLSASLLDLFGLSDPGFVPSILASHGTNKEPGVYAAWFVLPLLPWLRTDVLRRRLRALLAPVVVAVLYLALVLGPSEIWFFRWPLRVFEYFLLAAGLVFAVALSEGLARDRVRRRLAVTGLLLAGSAVLTTVRNDNGPSLLAAVGGSVLLLALAAFLLVAHLVRHVSARRLALVLIAGCGIVLAVQSAVLPANRNLRTWPLTTDVSTLRVRFADYQGQVMQFADMHRFQDKELNRSLGPADRSLLPGSMAHVAGVEAVNNYTGMGFRPFEQTLCLHYDGSADACGYQTLWQPAGPGEPDLADLMKLDTVVVQRDIAATATAPAGWRTTPRGEVLLLRRTSPQPYAGSRLSWASPGVEVSSARAAGDLGDDVELAAGTPGTLVFARLGWPGYSASLDGRPLHVGRTDAGLLTVTVPAGARGDVELRYRTPGLRIGLLIALAGLGVAVAMALAPLRRDRRRSPAGKARHDVSAGPPTA